MSYISHEPLVAPLKKWTFSLPTSHCSLQNPLKCCLQGFRGHAGIVMCTMWESGRQKSVKTSTVPLPTEMFFHWWETQLDITHTTFSWCLSLPFSKERMAVHTSLLSLILLLHHPETHWAKVIQSWNWVSPFSAQPLHHTTKATLHPFGTCKNVQSTPMISTVSATALQGRSISIIILV